MDLRQLALDYAESHALTYEQATNSPLTKLLLCKKITVLSPTYQYRLDFSRVRLEKSWRKMNFIEREEVLYNLTYEFLEIVRLENEILEQAFKILDRPQTKGPITSVRINKYTGKENFVCYTWVHNKDTVRIYKTNHLLNDNFTIKRGFHLSLGHSKAQVNQTIENPLDFLDTLITACRELNLR